MHVSNNDSTSRDTLIRASERDIGNNVVQNFVLHFLSVVTTDKIKNIVNHQFMLGICIKNDIANNSTNTGWCKTTILVLFGY